MKTSQVIFGTAVLLMTVAAFAPVTRGEETAHAEEGLTMPMPIPASMVQPVYPEQEKADGIEGTVLLGLEVTPDGTVGSIKAEQEVGNHPAFTSSAIAAVGKWRFEPARQDGHPVPCSIKVPVRFALCEKKK